MKKLNQSEIQAVSAGHKTQFIIFMTTVGVIVGSKEGFYKSIESGLTAFWISLLITVFR